MAIKINLKKVNKNWIVLGVAVVVGGIAAYTAQTFLRDKINEIEAKKNNKSQITVVVAKRDLEKGTILSGENVASRPIPKEWAASGSITPDQFSSAQGSQLAHPVVAGEAIIWAHLEPKREPNFSATLTPGRRAVTLPVDDISSISGMLQPGDIIDLVVSLTVGDSQIPTTFTLLQSVTVLATGTYDEPGVEESQGQKAVRSYNTVTLDVAPEDAKRVIAARNIGRVTALLRAPGDIAPVSAQKLDAYAILGLRKVEKRPPAQPKEIPVIYGGGQISAYPALNEPTTAPRRGGNPSGRAVASAARSSDTISLTIKEARQVPTGNATATAEAAANAAANAVRQELQRANIPSSGSMGGANTPAPQSSRPMVNSVD